MGDMTAWAPVASTLGVALLTVGLPAWWAHRRAMRGIRDVAASVGEINGHGTVQDATGVIADAASRSVDQGDRILSELAALRRTQHAMQTSIDSVVDAASVVGQRLKAHDREIADLKHKEH